MSGSVSILSRLSSVTQTSYTVATVMTSPTLISSRLRYTSSTRNLYLVTSASGMGSPRLLFLRHSGVVFDSVDENGIYHSTLFDLDPADLPEMYVEAEEKWGYLGK